MRKSLISICASCMCAASFAGTLETINVDVDGQRRRFNLFTPSSYDPAVPMPLVFALHGFTVSADTHQLVTGLDRVAENRGVLVAYPQAINNNWFPGHVPGNNIDYLVEVYEATVANRNVDKEIVGLSGLSQGSTMSLTLAAAKPDLFSSVVSVAGTQFFTSDDEFVPPGVPEVPVRPISRLHVHGTADTFVPVDGRQVLDFPLFNHSVMDSVTDWAAAMGFEGEPTVVPIDDRTADGLTSELLTFPGRTYAGVDGTQYTADTEYVRVLGGGHNWPGDWNGWPADFRPVTTDFSTSQMAIDFILSHPREYIIGDFTRNGVLDVDDIDLIVDEAVNELLDLTGDGVINREDRSFWATEVFGTYIGDANLDGEFNSTDLVAIFKAGEYEDAIEDNSGWAEGDWDGDGDFISGDLVAAFTDGGYERGPRGAAKAVPEPASLLSLMAGTIGIVLRRRRVKP